MNGRAKVMAMLVDKMEGLRRHGWWRLLRLSTNSGWHESGQAVQALEALWRPHPWDEKNACCYRRKDGRRSCCPHRKALVQLGETCHPLGHELLERHADQTLRVILQILGQSTDRDIMRLEGLPADLLETICSFLTGFDTFQLSHTNEWWFEQFSDGLIWHERMVHGPIPENQQHLTHTWKRRYMQSRSMLFHGLGTDDNDELTRASYACVEYPPPTDWGQFRRMYFALRTMHEKSFSFDLWFSLLPEMKTDDLKTTHAGGIIFGLQSEERDSRNWPQYHQQFVMVDSKNNLYCSVLDVKRPIAEKLKCHHWYHLLLTYDLDHQRQDVYLDGENVWSTTGALHREWHHLLHEQVGTGYITAGGGNYPHGDFVGWYGFHGLLDEFRFYSGVLHLNEIRHLACGGELSPKRLSGSLKYPGLRGPQSRINVELVACTRPAEGRTVEIIAMEHKVSQRSCCPPRALFA